jgi:aerobic carbon-monoxide dehydrogenase medium subunit
VLRPFALYRPSTLAEAGALLREHGEDATLYAGGTELLLLMKEGLVRPRVLVDVKHVAGLGEVVAADGAIRIGATASHRTVERSAAVQAHCPLVAGVARHVANARVRAAGTVGGNLAFADPHSDLATLFLVFDARIDLRGPDGEREVPLDAFVLGPYETARRGDEILTAVRLRSWPVGAAGAYLKFGLYERPTLGVAAVIVPDAEGRRVSEARLAIGCIGPRPQRLGAFERHLRGAPVEELAAGRADLASAEIDRIDAVTDLHGSADYKLEMAQVFTRRALRVAAARAAHQVIDARYPYTVVV